MEIEKEMLKGTIDMILLALLYDRDYYGYELAKQVKQQTDSAFEIKEGTLYLAFKRLELNGAIESYWGGESEGGRRKYYRLLPDGKRDLLRRKAEWTHLQAIVDIFLKGVTAHD